MGYNPWEKNLHKLRWEGALQLWLSATSQSGTAPQVVENNSWDGSKPIWIFGGDKHPFTNYFSAG